MINDKNHNKNIVLIGMPGSGKTHIGREAAHNLGMNFIDMDESIEKDSNMTIPEIFSKYGEKYFRDLETQKAKELSGLSDAIISTGGGVVTQPLNMEYLKKSGTVFFIERSLSNIIASITSPTSADASQIAQRPLLKNNSEIALKKLYDERIELYRMYADFIVENNAEPEAAVEKLIRQGDGSTVRIYLP